ncbi:MAG: hypothetical protein M0P49_03000, partial [Bacilli bacterium]|nr:hypothetical protein [Bacilli bacterium]
DLSKIEPIDLSSYRDNKLVKSSPLLKKSTVESKPIPDIQTSKIGKGGNDKDSNMDLILSIIKLLVKIIDNTDKLSDIVDILKTEFAEKTDGKGSSVKTKSSETTSSKKTAKEKIILMINNSTSDKRNNDNMALLQQLDALARE